MLSYRPEKLRVLVADDHELIRLSLRLALKRHPKIESVDVASNGKEAVEMVKQFRPDVVVLDLQMPVMNGLTASTHIRSLSPETQIVAYSSLNDPQIEVMVQTAQIDALCSKDMPIDELVGVVLDLGEQTSQVESKPLPQRHPPIQKRLG